MSVTHAVLWTGPSWPRVAGYEIVDHPTENQLVALARRYFLKHERMRGITNPF